MQIRQSSPSQVQFRVSKPTRFIISVKRYQHNARNQKFRNFKWTGIDFVLSLFSTLVAWKILFIIQPQHLLIYKNKIIFAKFIQTSYIATLVFNLFYHKSFHKTSESDLIVCSLFMFMMEITHTDKKFVSKSMF